MSNVTESIIAKTSAGLHRQHSHPINILKTRIETHFARRDSSFCVVDNLDPVVTTRQNFDELLIPTDHPGRKPTDTYYVNASHVLRTHTSAHQGQVLSSSQSDAYLLTADVYRRDEVDPTHYPVFHQMEGIKLFDRKAISKASGTQSDFLDAASIQSCHSLGEAEFVASHLKTELECLIRALLGSDPSLKWRWVDAYFPFTHPSWELEVFYDNKWIELFGCGVIRQPILDSTDNKHKVGWAFGLGLERIAMALFGIPDIRLFWSKDSRFLSQFTSNQFSKFVPYSKYPVCYKDISFWLPGDGFHENDFLELVRDAAGDVAEKVTLIDKFVHPKTSRISHCYRIEYRSMDRTLVNGEVDLLQDVIRNKVSSVIKGELRG